MQKALENLLRNWTISLPTILIAALVLILGTTLFSVNRSANDILADIKQKLSMTIYLKDDADPFEVGALITSLESRKDVIPPVIYTSKEEAWKTLNNSFSIDSSLLEKYKFSLPASLTLTPRNASDVPLIETFIDDTAKGILASTSLSKDKQKSVTQKMADFIKTVQQSTTNILAFIIILFIGGGALLISSAIHLAITTRHKEITIMKLVGASQKRIALPFIIEGVLITVFAFALHFAVVLTLPLPADFVSSKFFSNIMLIEFFGAVLVGGTASWLTTLFHIRKKHIFS
jgi:cell division transport system permease protein